MKSLLCIVFFCLHAITGFTQVNIYNLSVNSRMQLASDTAFNTCDNVNIRLCKDTLQLVSFTISNTEDSLFLVLAKPVLPEPGIMYFFNEKPFNEPLLKFRKKGFKKIELEQHPSEKEIMKLSFKFSKRFSVYDLLIVSCVRHLFANRQEVSIIENNVTL